MPMILLIKWFVAHLIGDFILQNKKMVLDKMRLKLASKYLYLHTIIHGVLVYTISMNWSSWLPPLLIAATHLAIDIWKLYQKNNLIYFFIDQLLHIICILGVWTIYNNATPIIIAFQYIQQSSSFWLLLTGYVIIIWPLSMMLGLATQKWRVQIQEQSALNENTLAEAGRWIGVFERVMVFTFIMTNHFEGIGLLITAKSILRFNDTKGPAQRKEAEYVLIGTLMSFCTSIVVGLIFKYLIEHANAIAV